MRDQGKMCDPPSKRTLITGLDFEFLFTFDFEARPQDPAVLKLLAELSTDPEIEHFTFLGAYAEN